MEKEPTNVEFFPKWDKTYIIQFFLSVPFIVYGGGRGIVPYILHKSDGDVVGVGLFFTGIICLSIAEITFHLRKIYFKIDNKMEK